MRSLSRLFTAVTAASLCAAPLAAQVIDTRNVFGATSYTFGSPTNYLVQTFTPQANETSLNNFSVWAGNGTGGFYARIFDITANSGTLFSSGSVFGAGAGFTEFNFSAPLTLTPFDVYGVYLTYLGGDLEVEARVSDTYGGGNAYTSPEGINLFVLPADLDFRAEFNETETQSAPEPATFLLLITGLAVTRMRTAPPARAATKRR